eukprot:gnl/Dysnectes_brevis/2424_a2881_1107.p1 GENE.gnl/Dysnectes_brevis/2424_a2881_1107~~gnl/Dysnectes_brevis/2424_a2881_1107.p1  ORF type:complete len:1136 (+),score=260.34 gnl/Dysnectes_brevis/2424_a2881_1107:76-3483(+)
MSYSSTRIRHVDPVEDYFEKICGPLINHDCLVTDRQFWAHIYFLFIATSTEQNTDLQCELSDLLNVDLEQFDKEFSDYSDTIASRILDHYEESDIWPPRFNLQLRGATKVELSPPGIQRHHHLSHELLTYISNSKFSEQVLIPAIAFILCPPSKHPSSVGGISLAPQFIMPVLTLLLRDILSRHHPALGGSQGVVMSQWATSMVSKSFSPLSLAIRAFADLNDDVKGADFIARSFSLQLLMLDVLLLAFQDQTAPTRLKRTLSGVGKDESYLGVSPSVTRGLVVSLIAGGLSEGFPPPDGEAQSSTFAAILSCFDPNPSCLPPLGHRCFMASTTLLVSILVCEQLSQSEKRSFLHAVACFTEHSGRPLSVFHDALELFDDVLSTNYDDWRLELSQGVFEEKYRLATLKYEEFVKIYRTFVSAVTVLDPAMLRTLKADAVNVYGIRRTPSVAVPAASSASSSKKNMRDFTIDFNSGSVIETSTITSTAAAVSAIDVIPTTAVDHSEPLIPLIPMKEIEKAFYGLSTDLMPTHTHTALSAHTTVQTAVSRVRSQLVRRILPVVNRLLWRKEVVKEVKPLEGECGGEIVMVNNLTSMYKQPFGLASFKVQTMPGLPSIFSTSDDDVHRLPNVNPMFKEGMIGVADLGTGIVRSRAALIVALNHYRSGHSDNSKDARWCLSSVHPVSLLEQDASKGFVCGSGVLGDLNPVLQGWEEDRAMEAKGYHALPTKTFYRRRYILLDSPVLRPLLQQMLDLTVVDTRHVVDTPGIASTMFDVAQGSDLPSVLSSQLKAVTASLGLTGTDNTPALRIQPLSPPVEGVFSLPAAPMFPVARRGNVATLRTVGIVQATLALLKHRGLEPLVSPASVEALCASQPKELSDRSLLVLADSDVAQIDICRQLMAHGYLALPFRPSLGHQMPAWARMAQELELEMLGRDQKPKLLSLMHAARLGPLAVRGEGRPVPPAYRAACLAAYLAGKKAMPALQAHLATFQTGLSDELDKWTQNRKPSADLPLETTTPAAYRASLLRMGTAVVWVGRLWSGDFTALPLPRELPDYDLLADGACLSHPAAARLVHAGSLAVVNPGPSRVRALSLPHIPELDVSAPSSRQSAINPLDMSISMLLTKVIPKSKRATPKKL